MLLRWRAARAELRKELAFLGMSLKKRGMHALFCGSTLANVTTFRPILSDLSYSPGLSYLTIHTYIHTYFIDFPHGGFSKTINMASSYVFNYFAYIGCLTIIRPKFIQLSSLAVSRTKRNQIRQNLQHACV